MKRRIITALLTLAILFTLLPFGILSASAATVGYPVTGGNLYYDTDYYVPALGHDYREGTCSRCGAENPNYVPPVLFVDVPENIWYYPAVQYAVSNKLMNGIGNQKFDPEGAMTRAMLVTVLWRYAGEPRQGSNSFTDVPNGLWYSDAVAWAAHNGIVSGIGNNRFDPDGKITREQMATILFRYSNSLGMITSDRASLGSFPDGGKVSGYAKDALSWAVAEGLITGSASGGKVYLEPQGNATRAQVATILMRYIENVAKNAKTFTVQDLIGDWEVDAEYTMDINNMSMWDFYGTSFSRSGNLMSFRSDGSYRYYVAWCYGNGTYELQNGAISINLSEGDPIEGVAKLIVTFDGKLRIGLDQLGDGKYVYWEKKQ